MLAIALAVPAIFAALLSLALLIDAVGPDVDTAVEEVVTP